MINWFFALIGRVSILVTYNVLGSQFLSFFLVLFFRRLVSGKWSIWIVEAMYGCYKLKSTFAKSRNTTKCHRIHREFGGYVARKWYEGALYWQKTFFYVKWWIFHWQQYDIENHKMMTDTNALDSNGAADDCNPYTILSANNSFKYSVNYINYWLRLIF